jgi:uncharacterized repeat protein (TIGR01451 family)
MILGRRLILLFVYMAGCTGWAVAQAGGGGNSLQCTTNVTVTPTMRGEGYAELAGDIVIICTGGQTPAVDSVIPQVNIQIFYNTAVTSRLLPVSGVSNAISEALLTIDEPGSGLFATVPNFGPAAGQKLCTTPLTGCVEYVSQASGIPVATDTPQGTSPTTNGKNVFQGVVSGNSVTYYGIPVLPPGVSASRVFRITNVRVNANPLAGSSGANAAPVQASISISGATSLSISNANPIVGLIMNGLTTAVSDAPSVSHCSNSTSTATLSFAESFGSAFKTRVMAQNNIASAGQNPGLGADGFTPQNVPGFIYYSESGLVVPVAAGQTVGQADFGTRLKATFNNVPAGVSLFVSVANVQNNGLPVSVPAVVGGPAANSGTTGYAQLTTSETGPFSAVFPSRYGPTGVPSFGIPVVNGTATAVWEVINTNPSANERLNFAVYATYNATLASGLGTMTVNLSYAAAPPAFSASDGSSASDTLPIPRYVPDANVARNELTVTDGICGATLAISQTKTASQFNQGEVGATYTVTVTNTSSVATTGLVTITETTPSGLTAVSMRGTGWNCGVGTCTRSDALAAHSAYPPITVVVNVAGDAPSLVFNTVTVAGGGDPNSHTASSQTFVAQASAIPPTADSVTPSSGSGANQTFALQYTDAGTGTNFASAWVWFSATFGPGSANSCMLHYDVTAATLYLLNDAGDQWLPATLQSSDTLQNSQCAVALTSSSVAFSGYTLTLDLLMTFKPAFAGTKNIYMYGANAVGLNTGWQTRGTWTQPAPGVPAADSVTPAAGSGIRQTFALQYSDTGGVANLATAWAWFNATFASSSANSCMLYYDSVFFPTIHLLNDAGTQWMSGHLGSVGSLQNSQCAVSLGDSSAVPNGNLLTLNLAMTFKPAYAGAKNVYMYSADTGGTNSGWQTRGTWTAQAVIVTADTVTPASGSGSSQTFALQYSDTAGATTLSTAWVWFNASFAASSANSCMVYYDRAPGIYYLLNDAGSQWIQGAPWVTTTIQNSQCSVNLSNSSTVVNGNVLTLNLAMTFKPAYAGTKNIYMYVADSIGANSAWQNRGTWTAQGTIVTADTVTPSSGSGSSQTFALRYSDTAGATSFSTVWVWFNATFSTAANSCMVYYDRAATVLNLINDAGTQWLQGTPGSGGTLQNSQCSVSLAGSSAVPNGNVLTLNLAVTFKPAYAGAKNVYMYGADTGGTNSGWQTRGTWTAQGVIVTADSVTPSSGSGSSQTFALQYSDTAGASSFSTVWVWFNATFSTAANSCMVYYDRAATTLYLINDAGTQWLPGTPGSGGTLQNSQCSISLATTSVVLASNTLTLNLAMTFKPAYAGAKNVYMYGADAGGTNSAWQTHGTWTVQ